MLPLSAYAACGGWTRDTATLTPGMQKAAGEKKKLGKQKAEIGREGEWSQGPTGSDPTEAALRRRGSENPSVWARKMGMLSARQRAAKRSNASVMAGGGRADSPLHAGARP